MPEINPDSWASIGPKEFAQQVKATPDAKIAEVMQGDMRGKILDEVFTRMPTLFRPDRAGSTNAVIHWIITNRPDGGRDKYEVVIENGACTVNSAAQREPNLAVTVGPVEFLKLVSGNGNPVMMAMTGKLKPQGDLALAANITKLFDIPKA